MGDALEKLTTHQVTEGFAKLAMRMDELAEVQKHTDERMDALILTVDEIVRGRKQP